MTISEAKGALATLPEKLSRRKRALAVTRDGKRVLAVLPWSEYETLMETLDILSDKKLVKQIRQGERDLSAGKGVSWEKVKSELGL
jgi:PHD/YefM family antitoxin component YafN of YafNO toxin-antitoxin module